MTIFYKAITSEYTVIGWSSLMVSIFFLSGVILIVLGVVGNYLGKVFNEIKRRPLFIIEEEIN